MTERSGARSGQGGYRAGHRRLIGLLAGAVLLAGEAAAQPAAPAAEAWPTEGTLFEHIAELQTAKIEPVPPAEGTLSIPYTRLDVAVYDGIAITRLLQVYHNHGDRSVGYGFSLPLLPDTTISQFNLWDRGQRLVGSIEDRRRAEETYREVTGDEAPTMNRDPGLVRRTDNRFDLRIFPIVPGESKQMELVSHRRLSRRDGEFILRLPLASLTQSQDPRHPGVVSRRVEVSIWVRDELPISGWSGGALPLTEVRREPNRFLLRLDLADLAASESPLGDVDLRFTVDLGDRQTVATTHTYESADGESYFSTRILTAAGAEPRPDLEGPPAASHSTSAAAGGPLVYFGVWRSRGEPLAHDPAKFPLEMTAFLTTALLPTGSRLHASWRAPKLEGLAGSWMGGGITTDEPIAISEDLGELESFLDELGPEAIARPAPRHGELLAHVRRAIEEDGCRQVLLFVDADLFGRRWRSLERLLSDYPEVTFTVVTPAPWPRLSGLGLRHVSHFALHGGWQSRRRSPARRLLEIGSWHELGFLRLDFEALAAFWQELPWIAPTIPALRWDGDVEIIDPQIYIGTGETGGTGGTGRTEGSRLSSEVLWLSGRHRGRGPARLTVDLPSHSGRLDGLFELRGASGGGLSWTAETDFGHATGQAFIASLWARPRAERLAARLRVLRELRGSAEDQAVRGELADELEAVRREVVELSRRHSFISSETAFIALPEDLREQHGIEKQAVDAQQLYNLEGMKSGGLPEPEEWMLLALGAALAIGLGLRRG